MPLLDSLYALATGDYTVTRTVIGTWANGIYTPGATTTLTVRAVLQPPSGLQRVIGGFEMHSNEEGRKTTDLRVLYTPTLMYAQHPDFDPDVVDIDGVNYTVYRVEPWSLAWYRTNPQTHYRVICTRQTQGAA